MKAPHARLGALFALAAARAALAVPAPWCSGDRLAWLICNSSAPEDARVADLVARFSKDGVYGQFSSIPGDGGVGLQLGYYDSEAYHGLYGVGNSRVSAPAEADHAVATDSWPPYNLNTVEEMTLANAFNRSLWRATAAALGREARAFYNLGGANGQTFWAPMANIVRDPHASTLAESSPHAARRTPLAARRRTPPIRSPWP